MKITLQAGELTESIIAGQIRPQFSRALKRDEIYLANHSLGIPPDAAEASIAEGLRRWYVEMDLAWDSWLAASADWTSKIKQLLGMTADYGVVPKASCGQSLRAVLNSLGTEPINIIMSSAEFDSVDFILRAYEAQGRARVHRVEPSLEESNVPKFDAAEFLRAITEEVDLVVISAVFFDTGQVLDGLGDLVARAHEVGARILVDAYHAVGATVFQQLEADFVIGGSYKYLRGGPGACFLAIHPRILESKLRTLDTGWFAKESTFGYERPDIAHYAPGERGWWESTPAVLSVYQALPGLEFMLEVTPERHRTISLHRQQTLREALRRQGVDVFEPKNPFEFGAFSLIIAEHAAELCEKMRLAGVNTDSRGPRIRMCPDILNSPDECDHAAAIIASVIRSKNE